MIHKENSQSINSLIINKENTLSAVSSNPLPMLVEGHQNDQDSEYDDPNVSLLSESTEEDDSKPRELDHSYLEKKIHSQLLLEEKKLNVSIEKIQSIQKEVTLDDREQTIMWIFKLNTELMYPSDIPYTTVTYFNIILSTIPLTRNELKLVAITCFRIAAKVELIKYPILEQINELSGEQFSAEAIRDTEVKVIAALSYKLSYPTVKTFLRRSTYEVELSSQVYYIANIIIEKATIKSEFLAYYPSIIAAAVVSTVLASIGDFDGAKRIILDSQCTDPNAMLECIDKMILIGRKLLEALSQFNKSAPIIQMFENTTFDFDATTVFVTK